MPAYLFYRLSFHHLSKNNKYTNSITPTEKKNETSKNLFIYSITMF
jgi:hypothetical protein